MTQILAFREPDEWAAAIPRVIEHLEAGGIIACPTETVYGFGCALQPAALERLAALKSRSVEKPFLMLVLDVAQLRGLQWNEAAHRLAAAFWPGPLTLALAPVPGETVPAGVRGPAGTVAARATPHPAVRALLRAFGAPITSTSANAPGQRPANSAAAVCATLEALHVSEPVLVLDGGPLRPSPPSTVVDCSVKPPRIVREGAISRLELERILHDIDSGQRDT